MGWLNSIPHLHNNNVRKQTKSENIFVIFDFELQTVPAKQRTEETAEQCN